ncbi:unnamed protein product [Caenorhabditis bovis]|uniref:Dynactin subunit 1 n=1 Tax=Caenorhabditis bovis TaxID=2654633 RepID=A0A8S1FCD7_9PELO|nr:unnamed protein product [Caenorhabditis bovis]
MSFEVGARVETAATGKGTVAFCGTTKFAEGEWVGIILDEAKGKNNGSVQGVAYFECEPNFGLFVRPNQLKLEGAAAPKKSTGIRPPSSAMSRSGSAKPSPGASPGISPAVSTDQLASRQTGMGARTKSKLADPSESRMVRESSNLSVSSVASTRTGVAKPRQSIAPEANRRTSMAPPRKSSAAVSTTAMKAPAPPKAEADPVAPQQAMTASGTELPTESVLSKAKKIDDTGATPMSPIATTAAAAAVHPPQTAATADHSTELEYLRLQVKELTDKLENTRAKRQEDHAKLLEYERISIEYRTLQEVKGRLNDKVVDLERQLLEERKACEDLKAFHENNKDAYLEQKDMIEMAVIEKELAEEKADFLQQEVTSLTEKMEEMQAELEILKEEMASSGGGVPVGNSVQMKQIQQQNEKLRDALIKLRDLNGQATLDKQKAQEEAEKLRNENVELVRVAEVLKRQAELAESKIAGFQEQIDAAMGAEEMVTQLTNKNFDLEEKIAKLEEVIEDLEEARDLDEQLAEVQKQQEKDLMKEIEDLKITIHELNGRIRDEQKHSVELSQTILKFRERIAALNAQVQDHKDLILNLEEELHGYKREDYDQASMLSQLQITAHKNFAEAVERQLLAIELEFTRRQAGYLKAFLPDNFAKIGGDNESVNMVVMFPRLSSKAKLFAKLAMDCYPQVSGGMRREHVTKSHKAEQWAHVFRVDYIAKSLIAVLGQFESAVNETTVEVLMKLTSMYGEMSTHERAVDQYLELLKIARFDENTSLENFEKPVLYFQNVFSVHIGGDDFNTSQWVSNICAALLAGFAYCKVNVQRIGYFLQESVTGGEVVTLLKSMGDEIAACEAVIVKASKLIPNDPKKVLKIDNEFTEELLNSVAQLDRISSVLRETGSTGAMQIGGISESEGFDEKRVKEMIHGVVVKHNGWIAVENAFEPIRKNMNSLRDSLEKVHSALETGRMEKAAPEKKNFPPLLDRAHHRKQAASEAEGLRWQMEKKDNEMLELRKQIKARIEDVSNYKLRLEMVESRIHSTDKAENDKVKHLEEKLNQLVADQKRQQIEYDETMDALRLEMKEIEKENMELKQRASKISKEALYNSIQSMESRPLTNHSLNEDNSATRGEVVFLEHRLNKQTDARKRAELEVMKLRSELAQTGLKRFGPVPGLISGPISLEAQSRLDHLLKLFDKLHDEWLRLKREENKHLVYVPSNPKVSTAKMMEEMEAFNRNRDDFYDRLNSVNRQMSRVWFDAFGEQYPLSMPVKTSCKDESPERLAQVVANLVQQEDPICYSICFVPILTTNREALMERKSGENFIETRNILIGALVVALIILMIVLVTIITITKHKETREMDAETPPKTPPVKKSTGGGGGGAPLVGDEETAKSFEPRMRVRAAQFNPQIRAKHRKFIINRRKREIEDARSDKFHKRGAIFIPREINDDDIAKKCEDPDNIILEKVFYDERNNEQFDIGSEIDEVELAPSTVVTLTEDARSKMKSESLPKSVMKQKTTKTQEIESERKGSK